MTVSIAKTNRTLISRESLRRTKIDQNNYSRTLRINHLYKLKKKIKSCGRKAIFKREGTNFKQLQAAGCKNVSPLICRGWSLWAHSKETIHGLTSKDCRGAGCCLSCAAWWELWVIYIYIWYRKSNVHIRKPKWPKGLKRHFQGRCWRSSLICITLFVLLQILHTSLPSIFSTFSLNILIPSITR